jgi:GT2 family glycosyltransferase
MIQTADVAPVVSICIVTYNAAGYVRRCLESIRRRTQHAYELVVVDNASRLETRELLRRQSDLKLALNDENRLWCAGINQAMRMADPRSPYLLLLNPDVEVVADNWLAPLIGLIESGPRVAVAGTTHRYSPAGPVHGWIDGCCFMVRHPVMRALGYFDAARFPWSGAPAMWTIRAWKAGWTYRVANRKDRLVLHHQHRSIEDQDPGARRPPEAFRMPVRFEAMLAQEGIEPRLPALPRRLLDAHFRPARSFRRFYASPSMGRWNHGAQKRRDQ